MAIGDFFSRIPSQGIRTARDVLSSTLGYPGSSYQGYKALTLPEGKEPEGVLETLRSYLPAPEKLVSKGLELGLDPLAQFATSFIPGKEALIKNALELFPTEQEIRQPLNEQLGKTFSPELLEAKYPTEKILERAGRDAPYLLASLFGGNPAAAIGNSLFRGTVGQVAEELGFSPAAQAGIVFGADLGKGLVNFIRSPQKTYSNLEKEMYKAYNDFDKDAANVSARVPDMFENWKDNWRSRPEGVFTDSKPARFMNKVMQKLVNSDFEVTGETLKNWRNQLNNYWRETSDPAERLFISNLRNGLDEFGRGALAKVDPSLAENLTKGITLWKFTHSPEAIQNFAQNNKGVLEGLGATTKAALASLLNKKTWGTLGLIGGASKVNKSIKQAQTLLSGNPYAQKAFIESIGNIAANRIPAALNSLTRLDTELSSFTSLPKGAQKIGIPAALGEGFTTLPPGAKLLNK